MRALISRSRLYDERGASLVIILLLISILGICIGAIATQGTAGMLAVKGVSNQRSDIYGAESAMDGAINYIRNDASIGRLDDTKCLSSHDINKPIFTLTGTDVGNIPVTCKYISGSGDEVEGVNYPENAVLTTSGLPGYPVFNGSGGIDDSPCSGDPGVCVAGSSPGEMTVDGSVKSNATSASGASIVATGSTKLNAANNAVRAAGTCTGSIVGAPVLCGTGTARLDPGGLYNQEPTGTWAPELTSVPPVAPQPSCNTLSKVATMQPGSYFDRDQMLLGFSKVVSGTRISCPVVWMQPGNYYFDLDKAVANDPWRIGYDDALGQDHLYTDSFTGTDVPGSVVIGGTLNSAINPNATTSQVAAARAAAPGACNQNATNGVQVMMANYTAFDVKDQGILELCPSLNATKQRIALFGRKTSQGTTSATATFKPSAAGSATPTSLASPLTSLTSIDGSTTTGTQTGNNKTNTVTLSGYAPTATLVPDQSVSSVTVKIAHRETTSPSSLSTTFKATLTGSDGSSCSSPAFSKQTTLTSETWSVPSSCVNSLSDLTGASIKWDVIGGSSGSSPTLTSYLDGIEITANYTARGLQAKAAGSRIVWMYGHWGVHKPQIYIWGTVYAPTARIELGLESVSTTIAQFGRGVVVGAVWVTDLGVKQTYAAFSNASGVQHYADRKIELVAYVGNKRQLRAVVELDDHTDLTKPGKKVTIDSWNAVN